VVYEKPCLADWPHMASFGCDRGEKRSIRRCEGRRTYRKRVRKSAFTSILESSDPEEVEAIDRQALDDWKRPPPALAGEVQHQQRRHTVGPLRLSPVPGPRWCFRIPFWCIRARLLFIPRHRHPLLSHREGDKCRSPSGTWLGARVATNQVALELRQVAHSCSL
jgi:hypothetical protein